MRELSLSIPTRSSRRPHGKLLSRNAQTVSALLITGNMAFTHFSTPVAVPVFILICIVTYAHIHTHILSTYSVLNPQFCACPISLNNATELLLCIV